MRVHRTPDERFAGLEDWPHEPRYVEWQGLRVHHVDVAPSTEPAGTTALFVHGEPTWAYMWRRVIDRFSAAGIRCVAFDHIGFGRSDKVLDDDWYTIERHCEVARHVLDELDLRDVMLVAHDWGGPIGLRLAVDQPERFSRLVVLNTWLHHEGMVYGEGWRQWRELATGFEPETGDLPVGDVLGLARARPIQDPGALKAAYEAPFDTVESKAGARRFPWLLPWAQPQEGNAAEQQRCHEALCAWSHTPIHLVWPDVDPIFELEWGRRWAEMLPGGTTLDVISSASHFVAEEAGDEVADVVLRRMSQRPAG
ncbi:alpha/beta fold hydrolase [Conexibacter sp. SYSU D00693]|uniref:alpha/beta fold hydrolase n=1 Tax=Conexibacter sp. SYSU D00693 TaxID=2812560 RepID=UPI00196AADD0|nr:alpha/beta fold hydrolase [Conexibacter sp. SYSU D00693]